MNKYLIPVLFIALVTIGVMGLLSTRDELQPVTISDAIYCSPDGTLSDKKPMQSHRSYCIKSNTPTAEFVPNAAGEYSFVIVDDRGDTLKDFAITHTKPMHVIVVRKDLQYFQHLHPEFNTTTGEFTLPDLTFPDAGQYRIFADFAPQGGMRDAHGLPLGVTLSEDVKVGGRSTSQPIGGAERVKTFGAYEVTLTTTDPVESATEEILAFSLTKAGQPVTDLEPYLGALGHSVILREGTLDFIHTHPVEPPLGAELLPGGPVEFMVTFPSAGNYKVFSQFQHAGEVITTDFVVPVAEGSPASASEETTHMGH